MRQQFGGGYLWSAFAVLLVVSLLRPCFASGEYFEVTYPPSASADQLQLEATYRLWVPENAKQLRAIIVHQHGCGLAANRAGETAAYDLHWQALAKKWDAAILAPHYKQKEQGREGCHLWSDPRRGSRTTLLRSLDDFAMQTGHPELISIPWCLWGHSGGASWVSVMQTLDPNRIVAAWLRSGTAFPMWESGEYPMPTFTDEVYRIPTMLNPGIKESTDGRPIAAWLGSAAMFKEYRAKSAPIGFAADPLSGHDCGDSRYLAIPYFDACLEMRLPDKSSSNHDLKTVDMKQGWLAELMGRQAMPASDYKGKATSAVWLPNERIARAWMEYVVKGAISDNTPPSAPTKVTVTRQVDGKNLITWQAEADFESGIGGFIISRDGKPIGKIPEKPVGNYGRPLFQTMSFHDTPEKPLPDMQYVDNKVFEGTVYIYSVITVNSVGIESEPANADQR